jgi:hypothetical protein
MAQDAAGMSARSSRYSIGRIGLGRWILNKYGVIDFTARCAEAAYLFPVALEYRTRADAFFGQRGCGGRAMLPFESYREVLSEHIEGRHVVASAWIIVVALGVLLVMFA